MVVNEMMVVNKKVVVTQTLPNFLFFNTLRSSGD
jgi:hypothetical protein